MTTSDSLTRIAQVKQGEACTKFCFKLAHFPMAEPKLFQIDFFLLTRKSAVRPPNTFCFYRDVGIRWAKKSEITCTHTIVIEALIIAICHAFGGGCHRPMHVRTVAFRCHGMLGTGRIRAVWTATYKKHSSKFTWRSVTSER